MINIFLNILKDLNKVYLLKKRCCVSCCLISVNVTGVGGVCPLKSRAECEDFCPFCAALQTSCLCFEQSPR